jgi:hypothetical protein
MVVGRSATLADAGVALFLKFSVADQPEATPLPTPQIITHFTYCSTKSPRNIQGKVSLPCIILPFAIHNSLTLQAIQEIRKYRKINILVSLFALLAEL